jgi:hypothetical protein
LNLSSAAVRSGDRKKRLDQTGFSAAVDTDESNVSNGDCGHGSSPLIGKRGGSYKFFLIKKRIEPGNLSARACETN